MTTVEGSTANTAETGEIPTIVSVDDHVVEPPSRQWGPGRFKDRVPRSKRRGVGAMKHIGGGAYEQEFDPDVSRPTVGVRGPRLHPQAPRRCRRLLRDEMTMTPMTYDEMRPIATTRRSRGHDQEKPRRVSLCFPTFPALRTGLHRAPRSRDGEAWVKATNDWMVEGVVR